MWTLCILGCVDFSDVRGGMCTSEGVWTLGGVCGLWHVDLGGGVVLEVFVGVWTLGGVCVDIGRCTGWQVEGCSCGWSV